MITLNINSLVGKLVVEVPSFDGNNHSEEYSKFLEKLSSEVRESVLSAILDALHNAALTLDKDCPCNNQKRESH